MIKQLALFILFALVIECAAAQNNLIEALNQTVMPLTTISPDSSFEDLNPMIPILKTKKIVGLGEASHGTHEFVIFRHRLIKMMVTQLNYRVFIIEGDFAGSQIMNDYILHNKGSVIKGLFGVGFGIHMSKEFVEMIEWMKAYNLTQDEGNKIRFYGSDMQFTKEAALRIKNFLIKNKLDTVNVIDGLDWYMKRHSNYKEKYSDSAMFVLEKTLVNLDSILKKYQLAENMEVQFTMRCLTVLHQNYELFNTNLLWGNPGTRDKYMAENIAWIYKHEGNRKAIFWAHNGHLMNNKGKSKKIARTGWYLKQEYGSDFYILATDMFKGSVRSYNREKKIVCPMEISSIPYRKSIEKTFVQCRDSVFIIDFKRAMKDPILNKFLNSKMHMHAIGAGYNGSLKNNYIFMKPSETFDGIVFFRNSTPLQAINKKKK